MRPPPFKPSLATQILIRILDRRGTGTEINRNPNSPNFHSCESEKTAKNGMRLIDSLISRPPRESRSNAWFYPANFTPLDKMANQAGRRGIVNRD
jgi:hypothetical protein